jgi:hypothetical protein
MKSQTLLEVSANNYEFFKIGLHHPEGWNLLHAFRGLSLATLLRINRDK